MSENAPSLGAEIIPLARARSGVSLETSKSIEETPTPPTGSPLASFASLQKQLDYPSPPSNSLIQTSPIVSTEIAKAAVQRVIDQLQAEVASGALSWSLVEAVGQEWRNLLAEGAGLEAQRQFLLWYVAEMRGGVELITPADWRLCAQQLRRWRGLLFYGIDQAVTRVLEEGAPFWRYVDAVCRSARAEMNGGAR